MAGLAHSDPTMRVECLRKCVASNSAHPKIQELNANMDAVEEFVAGGGVWADGDVLNPLRIRGNAPHVHVSVAR